MANQQPPRHPRQRIIDLSQAIYKNYKPLVNEKTKQVEGFELLPDRKDHTRDELLMLGCAALADIKDFIEKYEEIKNHYEHLTADAMMAYARGKEFGVEAESLDELAESLIGKFKQACDVLRAIERDPIDVKPATIASQFLSRFVVEQGKVVRPDFSASDGGEGAGEKIET